MAFLLLVSDLGYLGSQSTLPTYTSHNLGRGGLGRSLCPRPLGGRAVQPAGLGTHSPGSPQSIRRLR